MPDNACRGISVEGAQTGRTTHYQGHIVAVDNPQHVKALRSLGAFPASATGGMTAGGYDCPTCGFASFFRRCGRCGSDCVPT
jgi:hypothetical protein